MLAVATRAAKAAASPRAGARGSKAQLNHDRTPGAKLRLRVAHPPDRTRAVVGDEQRTVAGHGNADRAAPDGAVVEHEAGEEILILAAGARSTVARHADHFVAGARRLVPRAVLGGE